MANQTSIIDIQVNDETFQSYLASVREYRELMREAGEDLQKALDEADTGGTGRTNALKEEIKTRKALAKAARDATFEENRGEDAENRQNTRLRDRIRLILEAGRHQRENINAAMKFAKSPIGKLGIAGAAAAGLVKALNAAANLAQQGTDLRTQAKMAGMDAGHYTAWQRNLEPYDPNGVLLQHAVEATRDGAEAAKLQAIGVDTSSNDPSKILASLVPALRQFRNAHQGPAERQVFEGLQLGDLVETADLLGRTSATEVNAIPGTVEQNARRNQVSDDVLRRHQEASLNVGRRHDEWTATKLNTLAPVVEGMAQGAEKAQEHLDDLAIAAAKAAGSLDSLTGGNGALVGGIAAALGPSLIKSVGLKALPKLGGALLGRSIATPLLRMAGPLGAIIAGLTPHELGADDTFDMAHHDPGSIRRVTASSGTSNADLDHPVETQGLPQTMPVPSLLNKEDNDALRYHQETSLTAGHRHDEGTASKLNTLSPVVESMTQGAEKAQEHLDDLAIAAAKAAGSLARLTGQKDRNEIASSPATGEQPPLLVREDQDTKRENLPDDALRHHQETSLNVSRRHDEWTAAKLNTLTPVVNDLTQGAKAAQEHLDDLALSSAKATMRLSKLPGGGMFATVPTSSYEKKNWLETEISNGLSRLAGSIKNIIAGLTPHELEADDTFDMAHRNPDSIRQVTAPSDTSEADLDRLTGAVAMAESHGDPNAVSPAGAQGLLQTMPSTFHGLGGTNPFDPQQSWQIGRKYLKQLLGKYHDTEKALAAYNWGPGNLDADIRQRGDNWRDGLKKETRDYIPRVMHNFQNNTIVRIENYSGQDLSVAARQGAVL